jgi:Uncharacterized protein conserved in bacteria
LANKLAERVREATEATVAEMGFELADVEFVEERDTGWVLTLYIYREEGVQIDDCERVSRAVEPIIDEVDPSENMYFLSVSSLGLERPFKTERDFVRYLGKKIELRFYVSPRLDEWLQSGDGIPKSKAKGKKNRGRDKELAGVLRALTEKCVEIEVDGSVYSVPREAIALARPHIEF